MGLLDWHEHEMLKIRVQFLENLLRTHEVHETDCPSVAAEHLSCTCWLSEPY